MIPGISTACFYPMYTETALGMLARLQPRGVEFFINSACELEPGFLKEMRRIVDDAGIRVLSVHPYTSGMEPMYFFSGYDRRFSEGTEVYQRYFQAANLLGADIVVFHGGMRSSKMSYNEYFRRFNRLWEMGACHGVELCHENVARCIGYCSGFFTAMAEALPQVCYVLDTKQAVRAGEDVYEFAKAMGKRLRHVHISDHLPGQDCLVPGRGVLNIPVFLSTIKKNGFDGGVIVELYRENFDTIVEINEGYQHICTSIST